MLEANGRAGIAEAPFPNNGWSGASLTVLQRGRDRFILKRTSAAKDGVVRATHDVALREGFVANGSLHLVEPLVAPYLGTASDGEGIAILMPDLSAELIAWERPSHEPRVSFATIERVVDAAARLHAMPWAELPTDHRGLELALVSAPGTAAPPHTARGGVLSLRRTRRRRAVPVGMGRLRSHRSRGGNRLAAGRAAIDSMHLGGSWPIGDDRSRPEQERIIGRFGTLPPRGLDATIGDWAAQVDLTWIVGLLLRGWRKDLDAEAGETLGSHVSAIEDLAFWCDRAVEAAGRRLA